MCAWMGVAIQCYGCGAGAGAGGFSQLAWVSLVGGWGLNSTVMRTRRYENMVLGTSQLITERDALFEPWMYGYGVVVGIGRNVKYSHNHSRTTNDLKVLVMIEHL